MGPLWSRHPPAGGLSICPNRRLGIPPKLPRRSQHIFLSSPKSGPSEPGAGIPVFYRALIEGLCGTVWRSQAPWPFVGSTAYPLRR